MPPLKTVLIVDDNDINRDILANILWKDYSVLQADNGQSALDILEEHLEEITAVILDIVMPVMDGYDFLSFLQQDEKYKNLPVIVITGNAADAHEIRALRLGAWDFITKPYNAEVVHFRLRNAIERSQLTALAQLKYLSEYDVLTGIYNKEKFLRVTRCMLDENPKDVFVLMRFDIVRFQLINSFFGTEEGDKLLIYIARQTRRIAKKIAKACYGRMESDIFCICIPFDEHSMGQVIKESKKMLVEYNPDYDIVPSIGVYIIDNKDISVEMMYSRATLAAKTCKGNYVDYYALYNESMSTSLTHEQEIVNEMNYALEHNQFEVYLQPKYNIQSNLLCGAEALVRWMHPQKGMLSPGDFIPIFERNGFITKLDYFVWEQVCKCLQRWMQDGKKPYPISVNVSRVNLYNPKLVENLTELVEHYQVEPEFLNLELTESAYTDNPIAMGESIAHLQNRGFIIMMDDFGSGYSSLNILKDISIDVLKIDMRFLSKTKIPGRGENILASVVRMAKWLNIPVVTEGVETVEQVEFLRSVGCDYVQGFYYARPMPIPEYEKLCDGQLFELKRKADKKSNYYRYDTLFADNQEMAAYFGDTTQAVAVYEFTDGTIELIRVNDAYYSLLGYDDMAPKTRNILAMIDTEHRNSLMNAFQVCVKTGSTAECEYVRSYGGSKTLWLHVKLKYISEIGGKHIVIGLLSDITMKKEIDRELQKYRLSLLANENDTKTILIVDDSEFSRTILKNILEDQYHFMEAGDGEEAWNILSMKRTEIDLILLDIIMPKMDGREFLKRKNKLPELDKIPVIIITTDDSPEQQIHTLSLGANDYIVKPLIAEVVVRRIKNVLAFNHRFKEMIKEYNNVLEQVKMDQMTGLSNRTNASLMIAQHLQDSEEGALMMLYIDSLKRINNSYGHLYGDKMICAVAKKIQDFFIDDVIIARMGGSEFAVFVKKNQSEKELQDKAAEFCSYISSVEVEEDKLEVSCSIGIAMVTEEDDTFESLYQNADRALYNAKCGGNSVVSIYGR